MSLHEASGFCLTSIGQIYSPVSCSDFDIALFPKKKLISKVMADSSSFEN